jgi:hypothetical protein
MSRLLVPTMVAAFGGLVFLAGAGRAHAGDPFTPETHRKVDRTDRVEEHARHVWDVHREGRPAVNVSAAAAAGAGVTTGAAGGWLARATGGKAVAGGRGSLYALCVESDHKKLDGGKTGPDAREATRLAAVLRQKAGPLYAHVETRVLTGKRANRAGILGGLEWLKKRMTPPDVALVFISSHGGYDSMGFFGVQPAGYRSNDKEKTAVWGQEVREALLQMPGRKIVLVETCNSGAFLKTPVRLRPLPNTLLISSCRVKESSGASMGYAMLDALTGAAANGRGVVTAEALERYLRRQVPRATQGKQHITVSQPRDMPPIALTCK